MIRTQYNYFTFPKVKETNKTKKEKLIVFNPYITVQGLDTSIFSMIENGITQEGETQKGNYSENMLVNAFSDPLDFETEFEKEYQRQFFDNIKETNVDDAENLSAKNEPSVETPKNATTTEQSEATN